MTRLRPVRQPQPLKVGTISVLIARNISGNYVIRFLDTPQPSGWNHDLHPDLSMKLRQWLIRAEHWIRLTQSTAYQRISKLHDKGLSVEDISDVLGERIEIVKGCLARFEEYDEAALGEAPDDHKP